MENNVITPEVKKVMVKAMDKATKKVGGITPAKKVIAPKVVPAALSKGLYQLGNQEFYTKFPEVLAMQKRLEKEGFGFFRFEITCSPVKKPMAKVVNIAKHNAPDDGVWSKAKK